MLRVHTDREAHVTEDQAREQAHDAAEINGLLKGLAERIGATARASAVFGEPVAREQVTVIPVAKATWGMGGGGGTHEGEGGSGGGGGMSVVPLGYIEVRDGDAAYRPLRDPLRTAVVVVAAAAAAAAIVALRR